MISRSTGTRLVGLTIIPQLSVCLFVFPSFDFHENRSHGELHDRPTYCSEPNDVQYDLSLSDVVKLYTIKRLLCGVRYAFFANVVLRLWRPHATVSIKCDRVAMVPVTFSFECRYHGRAWHATCRQYIISVQ